jgi:3-oxoacyl-[acyl-carrier protein] reductase
MNRLANKHCVIVGGRGVIGSAIAREFSRQGAILTILGRTDPDAVSQRMSHKLEPYTPRNGYDTAKNDDLPTKHRFLALDATNSEDCKRIFQRGVAEPVKAHNKGQNIGVGKVDVLVNCAGITQNHMLKRLGDDEMGEILETNLVATMLACKYARMQDAGCIINVSSLLALRGGRGASVYAASKAAIIGKLANLSWYRHNNVHESRKHRELT